MLNQALTPEKILEAAEAVLKRFGPSKTTVVDVAAALGVSHGLIYRHFPSKAALRDAVVQRWLARVSDALAPLCQSKGRSLELLYTWFQSLRSIKVTQFKEEPELFEAFRVLTAESRDVLVAYKTELERQVSSILRQGVLAGEIECRDPAKTAHALMSATAIFYHPSQTMHWNKPDIEDDFNQLWQLMIQGLAPRIQTKKESI